jgi:hypothetical protein
MGARLPVWDPVPSAGPVLMEFGWSSATRSQTAQVANATPAHFMSLDIVVLGWIAGSLGSGFDIALRLMLGVIALTVLLAIISGFVELRERRKVDADSGD